jgi:hypothetical protein
MPRNKYNRTVQDGAKENAVSGQCELILCASDVVQPQHVATWPKAMQCRVRGFYLKTQMKKRKSVDLATFKKTQTQSRGIPDLLVRLNHWPTAVWLGVELKNRRGTGNPTPEQRLLFDAGAVLVLDSADALWARIMELDKQLRGINGQGTNSAVGIGSEQPGNPRAEGQGGSGGAVDRSAGHRQKPVDS